MRHIIVTRFVVLAVAIGLGLLIAVGAASYNGAHKGALIGPQLQPRVLAALAETCWKTPENLVRGLAVGLSESFGYQHAFNDNHAQLGDPSVQVGALVLNAETLQPFTVISKSATKVVLRDSGGSDAAFPVEALVVTSRDVGLWEINIPASQIGTKTEEDLYLPAKNIAAACALWKARGFQPWVGFTSNVYLHDAYMQRALLGTMNMLAARFVNEAQIEGQTTATRTPFISLPELRKLYPIGVH